MAQQYTNPYGQQYYGASGVSPYATSGLSSTSAQGTAYNQYMTATSQYVQTPLTSQFSQYQPHTAYQAQPHATQPYGYGMQHHAQPHLPTAMNTGESANAVWMGDIDPWMDENFLYSLFAHTGEVLNVKLIRDKQTGMPSNYCFVHFTSQHAAQKVIENFNGQPIPGTNKVFRLNWAQYGMGGDKGKKPDVRMPSATPRPTVPVRPPGGQDDVISLFIGDLAPDVTDYYILSTFQYYYPSVYNAKVVTDPKTGLSKGYGFVYFTDDNEKIRALNEMQGYYLSYRPIRLNLATKKGESKPPQYVPGAVQPNYPSSTAPSAYPPQASYIPPGTQGPTPRPQDPSQDPTNTTVFVGGIDATITHEILKAFFLPYGEIGQVKIPYGKGCAFIEYTTRESAQRVLATFNGSATIGNCHVRLSWGRPAKGQQQQQPALHVQTPNVGSSSSSSLATPPITSPRPQITSQTTTDATALLEARQQQQQLESQESNEEEGYNPNGEFEGTEGYQPQYVPQQYGGSSATGEYVPGEEEGAHRPITNEDVNQAPPPEKEEEEEPQQSSLSIANLITEELTPPQKPIEDQSIEQPEEKSEEKPSGDSNKTEDNVSQVESTQMEDKSAISGEKRNAEDLEHTDSVQPIKKRKTHEEEPTVS